MSDFYMECFFNVFTEKSFKKILSSSQNILMIKDSNFKYVYANEKCLDFFDIHLEKILGKDDFQITNKDYAEQIRTTDKKALENEDIYNFRREIHGNVYSVDKCKIFLNDNTEGIWIVARDVSSEEKVKNSLKIEKETLFTTLKSIGDAVITTDTFGRITLMNKNAKKLTGWLETDAIGKSIDEVFKIIDADSEIEKINPVLHVINTKKQTSLSNNTVLISKTGNRYYISNLASPIISSEKSFFGVILVFRDVTEEYKTKRKLIDSQKQYQNLFYNMLSGFGLHKIIKNKKGIPIDYEFIEVNDGFEKHTGLKREEIIGKKITEVLPSIKEDPFDWIEFYGKVALEGKEMRIEQFSFPLQRWYNVYAFSPEYGYFATIVEDITSKKMMEIETYANQARLESLVKILQYQSDDPDTILRHALNESINLTNSKIGHIFSYNNVSNKLEIKAWSKNVLHECSIPAQTHIFNLSKTGLWGDVVRFKKSITDNNFNSPGDRKKGLPHGHAKLSKYLSIPIISDGEVVAIVGVANKETDYTKTDELQLRLLMNSIWSVIERKTSKQKVKREETIKHNLAESLEKSPLGMVYWKYENGKSEIINWNKSAEKIFGWKAAEAIGRDFLEMIYYAVDVPSAHERILNLKTSKMAYRVKTRCYNKKGKLLDIKWFVTYIKTEQNDQIYGMSLAENYTEINKYQRDLEFTKNQFEYALEGSQSGIWDLNIITDEVQVNDQWWKVYGYKKDEIPKIDNYSMMDFWRSRFHPDDKKKALEQVQNLIQGKSKFINSEYRIKHKDGHWVWILDRGHTTGYDRNNKPSRMTGTIQNISERMLIQKDMELRNFLADAFIENQGKTLFKEILKYVLNVTQSSAGFLSCINEKNKFYMAATESMFEETKSDIESYFTAHKIGLNWSKLMLQKKPIIRNKVIKTNSDFVNFQRVLMVPIEYNEKIIGHFLVANAKENYTNQIENDLKVISERISHLLYSRLQSIQNENIRKKAELELYQSEKKLVLALEASRIGSWDWDIEGDRIVFDKQFALIMGYTFQELVEKEFKSWVVFAHPDDVQIEIDTFNKLYKRKIPVFEVEQRYRHKTKGWVWISRRGKFTTYNDEGKPIRMNGTIIDITKRKKAEIETQNQKNELQWLTIKQVELLKCITLEDLYECVTEALSEKIPDSIILFMTISKDKKYFLPKLYKVHNDVSNIKRISVLLSTIMRHKYSIQNKITCLIPNRSISEIFIDNLYQSNSSIPKKAIKLGIKYFNVKRHYVVSLVGNKGHLANVYILIRNENGLQNKKTIESFVFKASLIFERILLENEEKEIKMRLEQVAEQAKSIIWETDINGEITYVSSYVKKLLGYFPSELIHLKKWSNIHSEEEKEVFKNKLEEAIKNKAPFQDLFTELKTIDGEVLYVSSSGVPIKSGGEVIGFRGSDYDITTLKTIDKAKNEFINTVSHEMRTPLTVIKEATGILSLGELSNEQKEVLKICNKNINRLSRITNDVLDYQKLQAKKVELVYENIDLKKFLDEIIADHKPIAEKKGLILSTSFHTGNTRLLTDSDKLYEVIGNLLNNAIKYTDHGSIKIVVKDKIFTGNVTIQIIDTGIGIPKKELPKLFKAFSQTSGVGSRKTGSTGLGLVICKEIVELFGGTITVSSSVGVGTTFSIELPQRKSLTSNTKSL